MKFDIDVLLNHPVYEEMRTPLFLRVIKNPPPWAFDIIQPWEDPYRSLMGTFIRRHYWTSQGSINVFQVIGTTHQQYQNRPWMDLFTSGKRMDINLPLQDKKPEYYRATTNKLPSMYFNTLDGMNYYIGQDGNHRTCIAKFMFYETGETQLHDVTINHYDIDEAFYQVYSELNDKIKQLGLSVVLTAESKSIKREDTAGWMIDYFQPYLIWKEYDNEGHRKSVEELNFEQAKAKLFELTSQLSLRKQTKTVQKSWLSKLIHHFRENNG
jgi:haemophilus-specific protein, uncharacterized